MNAWLNPVAECLHQAPTPITFFFRDDDAGWSDRRLVSLLFLFEDQGVPIDLAAIPNALDQSLVPELQRRLSSMPEIIGVHQHGWTHRDHESRGRKHEFGPSRSSTDQFADLQAGRARVEALFGSAADAIFTPPWNRCTQETVNHLEALGFDTLSRDVSGAPLQLGGLRELAVGVDWCRYWEKADRGPSVIAQRIADISGNEQPLGIMLHHAEMDTTQRKYLCDLLRLLQAHPNADCRLMRDIDESTLPRPSGKRGAT